MGKASQQLKPVQNQEIWRAFDSWLLSRLIFSSEACVNNTPVEGFGRISHCYGFIPEGEHFSHFRYNGLGTTGGVRAKGAYNLQVWMLVSARWGKEWGEGMAGRGATWETRGPSKGVERWVLQGQNRMSRTLLFPGKSSQPWVRKTDFSSQVRRNRELWSAKGLGLSSS